jgi:protein O-mannosyl-transferase
LQGRSVAGRGQRWTWFVAGLLVCLLGAVLFAPTLSHDFVWDDRALVLDDARIRSWGGVLRAFGTDFLQSSEDAAHFGYYRPLVTASLAADLAVWRTDAFGFHLTNLLLHLGCCLGVLGLGRRMGLGVLASGSAALLFAVHPMHLESVAWVSGRTDLMATLLSMGFLLLWDHPRRGVRVAGIVCLAGALLSKELALVVPVIAWLLPVADGRPRRWQPLIPAGVVVSVYALLRAGLVPLRASDGPPDGLVQHILSPFAGLWAYTQMLVWPAEQSIYLQFPPATRLDDPRVTMGLALVLSGIYLARVAPRPGRLGLAVLLSFLPLANVVRVAAPRDMGFPLAERFLYFPSALLALLLAWGVFSLVETGGRAVAQRAANPWPTRLVAAGPGLLALALVVGCATPLAMATSAHLPVWRSELALYQDTMRKVDNAPLMEWLTAGALRRAGRDREAHNLVRGAVRRVQNSGEVPPVGMVVTLANTTAARGDVAGAIQLLVDVPEAQQTALVQYNLGVLHDSEGRVAEAAASFEAATERRPDYGVAWLALGVNRLRRGLPEDAAVAFARASAVDPRHADSWFGLGLALRESGDEDGSRDALLKAVVLNPVPTAPRIDAAAALSAVDPGAAVKMLEEGVRRHPGDPRMESALARMRALVDAGGAP